MNIPSYIISALTNDYIKVFLKKKGVSYSNLKKNELINKLNVMYSENKITPEERDEFLALFFKYGNNRVIVTNIVNILPTNPVLHKSKLERKLKQLKEPTGYFNDINNITDTDEKKDTLFYQQIYYDENNNTKLIERGFYRDEDIAVTDQDGDSIKGTQKIFTWTVLDIENKVFRVHTRDTEPNYFGKNKTIRDINNKFLDIHKKIFSFNIVSAINEERTLYNIYKEMTEKAEAPFKEKIDQDVKQEIAQLFISVSRKIGYKINNDNLKIPNRIERLFERGLINQQYNIYSQFEHGKIGIIKRIVFFDKTGANVSAMVKEIDENISSYDIYFDTRDTLDEQKALNKLWAYWYYKSSIDNKKEKYEVKMEISEDFYITHFLRRVLIEEVAEHVFSKFREFEVFDS
ncbi:MAG: hypothetical protein SPG88_02440 [Enterococcus hirae]|uniref:hypothetical protein n=1 Tax=Enterococcus TaxID=1350 RepID=UPI0004088D67|nr:MULTISPECIES: hypothetical protein [Enterococcus]EMF0456075.1 hypothetical protein [Enterococcus hirae]KEI57783.1 hypothetical protein P744_0106335 [Enterococcus faecium UC10237]MCD4922290.1 hypothetical protein [Enterococcus faecium]MCD5025291.1 hypothetical protein [Enterococcus faecium]MCI5922011.1 hypothetical protein [Enterococcus hirae]